MTPLEKIKQGILNADFSLVVDGYNSMTGEELYIPNTVSLESANLESLLTLALEQVKKQQTPAKKKKTTKKKAKQSKVIIPTEDEVGDLIDMSKVPNISQKTDKPKTTRKNTTRWCDDGHPPLMMKRKVTSVGGGDNKQDIIYCPKCKKEVDLNVKK